MIFFFSPAAQISIERGEIIFILEVLKALNAKCFSLHPTTKNVRYCWHMVLKQHETASGF